MIDFLTDNVVFGSAVSLGAFSLGRYLNRKTGLPLLNPFLVAFLLLLALLIGFDIPLSRYMEGASYLELILPVSILLLALPLYRQKEALRKHRRAIITGIAAGVVTNIVTTIILCRLLGLDTVLLRSLLPRSITTPLGLLMVDTIDGIGGITMVGIIFNGLFGVIVYAPVYALFRIRHPIARGVAMGTTSHAIGTAKALELSELTGAMSGLAIVLTGLITIAFAPLVNLLL